jgi:hypothetical protein
MTGTATAAATEPLRALRRASRRVKKVASALAEESSFGFLDEFDVMRAEEFYFG